MHVRYMNYSTDVSEILSFLPELYESNFPGFKADSEFVARKRVQLRDATRDPGQTVFVGEDSVGICGFIWLVVEVDHVGRRRGEVAAIHVAQRSRGTGLGRQLMEAAESTFRTYGCDTANLMVTAANERAVSLYRQLGYQITRFQMEKPLKPDGGRRR